MIKGYGLVALVSIFLLFGCSEDEETITRDSSIPQNNQTQNESNLMGLSDNKENYQLPFNINKVDSKIVELNDSAFEEPLKGVRYDILLFSKEKFSAEQLLGYQFEIDANSPLKEELLGPIEILTMSKTLSDGYIYTLSFSTVYREHTQDELEALNKERDFNIFVNCRGVRYPVEYQS